MITNIDAIRLLLTRRAFIDDISENVQAIDMAIKALEKQIPKKMIETADYNDRDCCPNCKKQVRILYDEVSDFEYCPNCGQRLDWSEE